MGAWSLVLAIGCDALAAAPAQPVSPADAKAAVAHSGERAARWSGPTDGPAAARGKTVVLLAEDLRNGGIVGLAQGVREASSRIGWTVKVINAGGTPAGRAKALADALAARPDGLVFAGADARENGAGLEPFRTASIPVVGWHAGPAPGPIAGTPVAMNITTDPLEVARVTAMAAIAQSDGRAGVVVFTDSNFGIAMAKANAMAEIIRACARCKLLEVRDLAIAKAAEHMPRVTRELLDRHGSAWTHALAINDIYFDYALPVLTGDGGQHLSLLSAGDGSPPAFQRIRARTFQTGTVAEPLLLQGWQAVDELNRLFSHQPVSGFVAPAHLVTPDNVAFDGGPQLRYDPDNGYREAYARIWKR
ncbi:substrate-binding domain-containing protein [uncultured Azohydromonas sp.]|uniref:substrate-binding domain-containing protein n=1 Tax=uncultured Azohydromonas sp. TaxID=487342 RepID=UPI00262130EE|nr:substrate-binding domain-containing protein [uncultured Azohydromonas sp.]